MVLQGISAGGGHIRLDVDHKRAGETQGCASPAGGEAGHILDEQL